MEPYSYFRQSKRHLVEVQYLSLQTDDPLMLMHLVSSIILDLVLLQEDFPENSVSSTLSAPALSMLLAGCPRKIWEETNLLEGWLSLLEIFNLQVNSTSCFFLLIMHPIHFQLLVKKLEINFFTFCDSKQKMKKNIFCFHQTEE